MITIHTHVSVTNPLYFLIIKLYKIILYLYNTLTHSHKSHYNKNIKNITPSQYQTYTHKHII